MEESIVLATLTYTNPGANLSEPTSLAVTIMMIILIVAILFLLAAAIDKAFLPWQADEAEVLAKTSSLEPKGTTEGFIPAVNPAVPQAVIPIPFSVLEEKGKENEKFFLHLDFLEKKAKLPVSSRIFEKAEVGAKIRLLFKRSRIRQKIVEVKAVEIMPKEA